MRFPSKTTRKQPKSRKIVVTLHPIYDIIVMAKKIHKGKNTDSTQSGTIQSTKSNDIKVVANCDNPISSSDIEKMILTIRGQQVMIDRDLAGLYGVTTSRMNEQVKRNIARFPSSFRFQLTSSERDEVVANCDNLRSLKFNPSLPFAFTEQGIAQLSSVLHSPMAIDTSIKIMNAFVAMRRFLVQNAGIIMRISSLEQHQLETDSKIDAILNKIEQKSPALLPEQIFATGCVWDAWAFVSDLVLSAKKGIILIDNYVDHRVLSLFSKRIEGVTATIHTRYSEQFFMFGCNYLESCHPI